MRIILIFICTILFLSPAFCFDFSNNNEFIAYTYGRSPQSLNNYGRNTKQLIEVSPLLTPNTSSILSPRKIKTYTQDKTTGKLYDTRVRKSYVTPNVIKGYNSNGNYYYKAVYKDSERESEKRTENTSYDTKIKDKTTTPYSYVIYPRNLRNMRYGRYSNY